MFFSFIASIEFHCTILKGSTLIQNGKSAYTKNAEMLSGKTLYEREKQWKMHKNGSSRTFSVQLKLVSNVLTDFFLWSHDCIHIVYQIFLPFLNIMA